MLVKLTLGQAFRFTVEMSMTLPSNPSLFQLQLPPAGRGLGRLHPFDPGAFSGPVRHGLLSGGGREEGGRDVGPH
jgi:hypothetical protein